MALEDICAKHATEIAQLNRLVRYFLLRFHIFFFYSSGSGLVFPSFNIFGFWQVQQYKHERECNAMIEQTREEKIRRLEGLMDGVLPTEDFMEEELVSLTHEHSVS